MDTLNLYESLDDSTSIANTQRGSCTTKQQKGKDENHLVNYGFDYDFNEGYEQPLSTATLARCRFSEADDEKRARFQENDLYNSLSGEEVDAAVAARDANIKLGIRELSGSCGLMKEQTQHIKSNCSFCKSSVSASSIGMMMLLFVSICSSAYIIFTYINMNKDGSCARNIETGTQSMVMNEGEVSLAKLMNISSEVRRLQEEYEQFKLNLTMNSGGRHSNKKPQIRMANSIRANLRRTQSDLTTKITNVKSHCSNSIAQLNKKVSNFTESFKRRQLAIGECVFKRLNGSTSAWVKNRTVTLVEKDGDATELIGVTCCMENTGEYKYNSFLSTEEKGGNVTYSCHCLGGQKCDICYWECRNS